MALHPVPAALKLCFETIHLPDDKLEMTQRLFDEYCTEDIYEYHREITVSLAYCARRILKERSCDARTLLTETLKLNTLSPEYKVLLQCHKEYMSDLKDKLYLIPEDERHDAASLPKIKSLVEQESKNVGLMEKTTVDAQESKILYQCAGYADLYLAQENNYSVYNNPVITSLKVAFNKIQYPEINILDEIHYVCDEAYIPEKHDFAMERLANCALTLIQEYNVTARELLISTLTQDKSSLAWSSLTKTHKDYLDDLDARILIQEMAEHPSSHDFAAERKDNKYLLNSVECIGIDDEFYKLYDMAKEIDQDMFVKNTIKQIRGHNGP